MRIRYCWRCDRHMPMLSASELRLCEEARRDGATVVQREARARGVRDFAGVGELNRVTEFRRMRPFLDMYKLLTGFEETNPNAIWHHLDDLYGPDCPACGKPLRTPKARYCAACGFGKEDLVSPDTKPLAERRPELFQR